MAIIDWASIPDGTLVTINTAPIIYFLEDRPRFADVFAPLFQRIEQGRIQGVIASVTLSELLTGPLAHGNEILADRYYRTFATGSDWRVQELTAEIAFLAARIRARYRLKLPDAVQVATTLHTGSTALVTHDRDFRGLTEIRVLRPS